MDEAQEVSKTTGAGNSESTGKEESNVSGSVETGGAGYVPKDKYNSVKEKLKALQSEQESLNKKLKAVEDLEATKREEKLIEEKKYTELLEERSKRIEELTSNMEAFKQETTTKMFNQELSLVAKELNVFDVDDVKKLVSVSDFEADESGKFVGIREKLTEIKTAKPYLFNSKVETEVSPNAKPGTQEKVTESKQYGTAKRSNTILEMLRASRG